MKRKTYLFVMLVAVCFLWVISFAGVVDNLWKDNGDGSISPQSGRSLAIDATAPSTVGSLESGTSTYALNASGTISTFNRIYTINLATDTTLKIDSLTDVNVWVIYKNTTTAGDAGGVTIWSADQQIRDGVGSARTSGNTIFVNGGVSGNSGWEIALKALDYSGTLGWEVESCNATLRRP